MIDHLVGRPSPSWKRAQVFLVIIFWLWRILAGNPGGPRVFWLRRVNRTLARFTPWQLIVSTLTGVYALRNIDKILGLGSPEPLARLYSPSYYRATWISTGLDAGFATAMSIRPKWFRDICSLLFSVYYIIYANEGDEKLRRFRAVPTVEMFRTTWEKTSNPYIRLFTNLPHVAVRRKIQLSRPKSSNYQRPITAFLFFALPEDQLCLATDLVLDFPGGGFVAMTPEHHEERLRAWAIRTGRPVLSIDYGKAPEYPYPFAIDEAFDTYRVLVESGGEVIGMSGRKINIIVSGDSAGGTIAVNLVIKIIEHNKPSLPQLPKPLALVLNYAALDFNFTSWMSPGNLRVLRSEQSTGNVAGLKELAAQKNHLQHISPLSMVGDKRWNGSHRKRLRRRTSWRDTLMGFTSGTDKEGDGGKGSLVLKSRHSTSTVKTTSSSPVSVTARRGQSQPQTSKTEDISDFADAESEEDSEDFGQWKEEDRPIQARVRHLYDETGTRAKPGENSLIGSEKRSESDANFGPGKVKEPIGTRLTMTSRTGYFQDRIIPPSMMRAMAILYIGPHRNPDFATDYHISPILAPNDVLVQFPPLLMQCGEKDPFVDDTVIFAGRVREAKRERKAELEMMMGGEGLRMSEMEDEWVEMVLFSDWSHGYLQMGSLMKEGVEIIEELGDWIKGGFEKGKILTENNRGKGLSERELMRRRRLLDSHIFD